MISKSLSSPRNYFPSNFLFIFSSNHWSLGSTSPYQRSDGAKTLPLFSQHSNRKPNITTSTISHGEELVNEKMLHSHRHTLVVIWLLSQQWQGVRLKRRRQSSQGLVNKGGSCVSEVFVSWGKERKMKNINIGKEIKPFPLLRHYVITEGFNYFKFLPIHWTKWNPKNQQTVMEDVRAFEVTTQ